MVDLEGLTRAQIQSLPSELQDVYQKLQDYSLEAPSSPGLFSQKLARENDWSLGFAQEAIEEYKKFAFLAVASGHPVSPSEEVDRVWHLHLSYTKSYWNDFCGQVLGIPLHHEPSLGGESETQKFEDWYINTLNSYQTIFGYPAPKEFWPDPEKRFADHSNIKPINTDQNWILPKRNVLTQVTIAVAVLLLGLGSSEYLHKTQNISLSAGAFFSVLGLAAIVGLMGLTMGIIDVIKNPRPPQGCGNSGGGGGCGSSCGNCCGGGCAGGCGCS